MFSHMMVGSNDIERSRKFYDATFAAMGGKPGTLDARGRLAYPKDGAMFLVTPPIDGQPATQGNGQTIGFAMTPEQ
ncbi:MAG: VOC family protein, partial [Sphingomicrobium sp.]